MLDQSNRHVRFSILVHQLVPMGRIHRRVVHPSKVHADHHLRVTELLVLDPLGEDTTIWILRRMRVRGVGSLLDEPKRLLGAMCHPGVRRTPLVFTAQPSPRS